MVREFENKNEWAIILGASSGMGLATAKKLAKEGMNLCLVYRALRSDMESIESEFKAIVSLHNIKLIHFNKDVVKPENREIILTKLEENFQESGKVKCLVHSIAKGNLKPMVSDGNKELQNDDFHITLENMAFSLYDWTKHVFSKNLFAEDARIISFTSEGNKKAWKNYAAVSAAKVALEAISRNIALEFAEYGIKSNCIEAGVTDTASFRMIPGSEKLAEYTIKRNPFHRLTKPEDVANVVYLLIKEESKWINGITIQVNGGEHLS
ncbi:MULTISPECIES: SDR family oxidoreductase [Bizionia]|uniref:SDR family oxidoreductase n=1 Tax=Bizionia algoritergicola TaxID=291187 RepID=A0A5D0R1D4_9FLAO|nr:MULTISPECIES: SDR family oxidoreductase [Bizionia]OBX24411.1 short-chain dehydrogenase [Bizionia sp. APA-3]TYB75333.1 SDR family oxidoreductase [Bizionia algoritergicola]